MPTSAQTTGTYGLRHHKKGSLIIGAIIAGSIPVVLGLCLIYPFIDYIMWGCESGSASGKCLQKYWPHRNEPWLFELPVGFACIFLTPFVCWICGRYVWEENLSNELLLGELYRYTIGVSLSVHFFGAIGHAILSGWWLGGLELLLMTLFIGIFVHLILMFLCTIPMALLCVTVFRIIALYRFK